MIKQLWFRCQAQSILKLNIRVKMILTKEQDFSWLLYQEKALVRRNETDERNHWIYWTGPYGSAYGPQSAQSRVRAQGVQSYRQQNGAFSRAGSGGSRSSE